MSENLQQKYRFTNVMLSDVTKRIIVLMTGARQTGKTTLARMMYPTLRYINVDAPENREMLRQLHTAAYGETRSGMPSLMKSKRYRLFLKRSNMRMMNALFRSR